MPNQTLPNLKELDQDSFVKISLSKGYSTIVDAADIDLISESKWHATVMHGGSLVYAIRPKYYMKNGIVKKTTEYLHRLIMNAPKGMVVDHIFGFTLDNRRSQLRVCKQFQNGTNRINMNKNNKTEYHGVWFDASRGKFAAEVRANRKKVFFKRFDTAEEAARARDFAAKELHGIFARLNFP